MTKIIIDKNIDKLLNIDSIAETEKMIGKHYSQFNNDESLTMLANAFRINTMRAEYLSSLGDTSFSTKWNEFINIIESYGFKKGLCYEFNHGEDTDEAALYYHPEKGLIIWATSYFNKSSLNSGKLYGQVKSKENIKYKTVKDEYWGTERKRMVMTDTLEKSFKSLDRCSHDSFMDIETGINFDYDVREALINKIESISDSLEFVKEWNKKPFLWFLDYTEEKAPDNNYVKITKEKISKCPDELQNIVRVYMEN